MSIHIQTLGTVLLKFYWQAFVHWLACH